MAIKKIGVLTSGGDSPGMNARVRDTNTHLAILTKGNVTTENYHDCYKMPPVSHNDSNSCNEMQTNILIVTNKTINTLYTKFCLYLCIITYIYVNMHICNHNYITL